jgi:DNA polymerase-3 subunit beta
MLAFSVPVENMSAALIIAAKDDIRHYLVGVCFEVKGDRILTVATDGHRMLIARGGEVTMPDAEEKRNEFIVPRDALEDAIRKVKGGTVVYIQIDGQSIKLTSGARTLTSTLTESRFPEWRRVTPTKTNGTPAQYKPAYLYDFHRVGKIFSREGAVHVSYNGLDAALITFPGTAEVVGVLMPYKMGENEEAIAMLREVA